MQKHRYTNRRERILIELLSPAGNLEKLYAALHYGADAVYLAGKEYGLRTFADNFSYEQMRQAVRYAHSLQKKVYVTLNIFAHNADFEGLQEYLEFLQQIGADAVIVSDFGILKFVRTFAPGMSIHISTQANITNRYAAAFCAELGADRIVLARELTLDEIADIRRGLPDRVELEAFVHGAMCISYSGRCLLSNYMANRPSNHGECAQSCRWEYALMEKSRGEYLPVSEDGRGAYILNSKDLNMLGHIDKLADAGVTSFKIEGRVKSTFYVAGVTNAYRKAIDLYQKDRGNFVCPESLKSDLLNVSHRNYCTGFYLKEQDNESYLTSKAKAEKEFCGLVTECFDGGVVAEQRNRFKAGDNLTILSKGKLHGKTLTVGKMEDLDGNLVSDALRVQQKLKIFTDLPLAPWDILLR